MSTVSEILGADVSVLPQMTAANTIAVSELDARIIQLAATERAFILASPMLREETIAYSDGFTDSRRDTLLAQHSDWNRDELLAATSRVNELSTRIRELASVRDGYIDVANGAIPLDARVTANRVAARRQVRTAAGAQPGAALGPAAVLPAVAGGVAALVAGGGGGGAVAMAGGTLLATAAYEAVHGAGGGGGRTEAVAGAAVGAGAIFLATRSTTAALAGAAAELATWYLLSERLGITTWRGLQGTSAKIMKSE